MNKLLLLTIALLLLVTACSPENLTPNVSALGSGANQPQMGTADSDLMLPVIATDADLGISDSQPPTNIDCPDVNFIDVQANPANGNYPTPELSVDCTENQVIIHTNNIPNFEFVPTTPNALQAQDYTFTLPLNPTEAAQTTDVPLGGSIGVTVNGLVIFGPTEAPRDGYRDPYLDQILDYCNGHTAPGGVYHFHARPDCIYEDMDGQVGLVIGYAFDGYPILAPYICADDNCTTTQEVQSSWQDVNPTLTNAWERHEYVAGSGDLDECNGIEFSDGSYAYFATDTFPYFMGCYRGDVDSSNLAGGGSDQPVNGGGNAAQPTTNGVGVGLDGNAVAPASDRQPRPPRNGG